MTKNGLYTALDNAANQLRSKMDASEYKSYMLGIIFYKYLSDQAVEYVYREYKDESPYNELDLSTRQTFYQALFASEHQEDVIYILSKKYKYVLKPEHTFDALVASALGLSDEPFQLDTFGQALRDIEQSGEEFEGLFADVDLNSRRLGATRAKQSDTIANTIIALSRVDFAGYSGDALGDAYEYLIREFAMSAGQKAGEFYTPHEVSDLMARILMSNNGMSKKRELTVYDPTSGSGSLLLTMRNHNEHPKDIRYFGQELNTTTYNLARMNMILHGVSVENYLINNGDTLDSDWPTDEPTNFDAVMMNPPYSAHWDNKASRLDDRRFSSYGSLAPKTKADYAFLLHGYYHLKSTGVMAIVLPHGVLFRGGAEATIREKLLEDGAIEAVIGLPGGIFYSTDIPTTVLILRKDNKHNKNVLFIDASREFKKEKSQNTMQPEHIDKIVNAYQKREFVDKFAYVADFDEIKENDFNLNIPRYVDTFEPEPEIDLRDVSARIQATNVEYDALAGSLIDMMHDLSGGSDDVQNQLDGLLGMFGSGKGIV